MTDIADQGNTAAELFLQSALSAQRKLHLPAPDGRCHNCEASVPPAARWCDMDCQSDWDKHERAIKMRPVNDE